MSHIDTIKYKRRIGQQRRRRRRRYVYQIQIEGNNRGRDMRV